MKTRNVWTLLLVGAVVAIPGTALAQLEDITTSSAADLSDDFHDSSDFGSRDLGTDFDDVIDDSICTDDDIGLVADHSHRSVMERSRDQTVDVDEDDVLLAIALANNGANDITWNQLRDFDYEARELDTLRTSADLEREDVFSALALGVTSSGGSLDALACVSDVEHTREVTTNIRRNVDLDEDNVLLAIALSNSIGASLDFEDIASIDESARQEVSEERTVDVERNDAFLALALGAGG